MDEEVNKLTQEILTPDEKSQDLLRNTQLATQDNSIQTRLLKNMKVVFGQDARTYIVSDFKNPYACAVGSRQAKATKWSSRIPSRSQRWFWVV